MFYCFWCCCWCCSWTSIKFCQCLHVDIAANTHSCGLLVIFFTHFYTHIIPCTHTILTAILQVILICQLLHWFFVFIYWTCAFLQDWILTHWAQKATWQDTQLLTQHHSLCSQPGLHLWWTSYLFWPNFSHLQSLLLPYQTASLYPSFPWCHHRVHHCHLHRSLQTWLL